MQLQAVDSQEDRRKPFQVVRLVTSYWKDKSGGINVKKTLRPMKRHSFGYEYLSEDCSMIGVEEVIDSIVNFDQCKDGLYFVEACNVSTDWETGLVDDYDYRLVPFVVPTEPK